MKQYHYIICCVDSTAEKIHRMVDRARSITYETFRKYVDTGEINRQFGYGREWLVLKNDYHVSYHKSFYDGAPCVYMVHSAIEYIYG